MEQLKCKVVMLPTNQKAILYLDDKGIYTKNRVDDSILRHNLYITSNEDIKEGDWYLDIDNNDILKKGKYALHIPEICIKIIATTDESLITKNTEEFSSKGITFLPKPTKSFVEKYIEQYNKGNMIKEVMVEYEANTYGNLYRLQTSGSRLKINHKDNTITIKRVKDSWNKDEVELLIKKSIDENEGSFKNVNEWIKNNL